MRPSVGQLIAEPARGLAAAAKLPAAAPWLSRAPRGDGHGVLVLPGLLASDGSTAVLRKYLRLLGYAVRGWNLGRNLGPTAEMLDELPRALLALAESTGRPVSLIGWSLGGIYARELARQHPGHCRQVITLASPFAMTDPRHSRAHGAYQRHSHAHATGARVPTREQTARPVGVPSTAVYSRRDGVVAWQDCIEPETDAARERRGPVQSPRLRPRPRDALAGRRPARDARCPAAPVLPAACAARAIPRPAMTGRPSWTRAQARPAAPGASGRAGR